MTDTADNWDHVIELIHKAAFEKAVAIDPGPYVIVWDHEGACRVISAARRNFHFSAPRLNSWYFGQSKAVSYTVPVTL
jgi:hypothetical protein